MTSKSNYPAPPRRLAAAILKAVVDLPPGGGRRKQTGPTRIASITEPRGPPSRSVITDWPHAGAVAAVWALRPRLAEADVSCHTNMLCLRNYIVARQLGTGGSGVVFSAERRADRTSVAIKQVMKTKISTWHRLDDGSTVPHEVYMLRKVAHVAGVNRCVDYIDAGTYVLIVLERPEPCVDLFDYVTEHKNLSVDVSRDIFRQLVTIVTECYDNNVVHGDIKDENVLVNTATKRVTLIDFDGAMVRRSTAYTSFGGTTVCAPPEYIEDGHYYGESSTVWALGVLLYTMLFGLTPFESTDDILSPEILDVPLASEHIPTDAADLMRKCFVRQHNERIRLCEIMTHPWMVGAGS